MNERMNKVKGKLKFSRLGLRKNSKIKTDISSPRNEKILSYFPSINIQENNDLSSEVYTDKPILPSQGLDFSKADINDFKQHHVIKPTKIILSKKIQHKKKTNSLNINQLNDCKGDVNREHLEMALAMSCSLQDMQKIKSPDKETEEDDYFPMNTQEKIATVRKTLEQFGFKSNSDIPKPIFKSSLPKKRKLKYVTPTLFLRTEEDRQKIIQDKVAQIMTNIHTYNKTICKSASKVNIDLVNNNPSSFVLRDLYDEDASLFNRSNMNQSNCTYYTDLVPVNDVKIDCLLKDWHMIRGRERTPSPDFKSSFVDSSNSNIFFENQVLSPLTLNEKSVVIFQNDESDVHIGDLNQKVKNNITYRLCETEIKNSTEEKNEENFQDTVLTLSKISNRQIKGNKTGVSLLDFKNTNILSADSEINRSISPDLFSYSDEENSSHDKLNISISVSSLTDNKEKAFMTNHTSDRKIFHYETFNDCDVFDLTYSSNDSNNSFINNNADKHANSKCKSTQLQENFENDSQFEKESNNEFNISEALDVINNTLKANEDSDAVIDLTQSSKESTDEINHTLKSFSSDINSLSINKENKCVLDSSQNGNDTTGINNFTSYSKILNNSYFAHDELQKNELTNSIVSDSTFKCSSTHTNITNKVHNISNVNHETGKCQNEETELVCTLKCDGSINVTKECKGYVFKNDNIISCSSDTIERLAKTSFSKLNDMSFTYKFPEKMSSNSTTNSEISADKSPRKISKKSHKELNLSQKTHYFNEKDQRNLTSISYSNDEADLLNNYFPVKKISNLKKQSSVSSFSEYELKSKIKENKINALNIQHMNVTCISSDDSSNHSLEKLNLDEFLEDNFDLNQSAEKSTICTLKRTEDYLNLSQKFTDDIVEDHINLSQSSRSSILNDEELNYSCSKQYVEGFSDDDCMFVSQTSINNSSSEHDDQNMQLSGDNLELKYKYSHITFNNVSEKNDNDFGEINDLNSVENEDNDINYQDNCFNVCEEITLKHRRIQDLNKSLNKSKESSSQVFNEPFEKKLEGNDSWANPSGMDNPLNIVNSESLQYVNSSTELNKLPREEATTPNSGFIIKTTNVTPMGKYDEMDTPKRNKELAKYGLKPLKRAKSIKILEYIYNATHPVPKKEKVNKSSSEDENIDHPPKKRKKGYRKEKYISNSQVRKRQSQIPALHSNEYLCNYKISIVGDLIANSESMENMIFERKTLKIPSCVLPLHIAWHNFVSSNSIIQEKILLYEPLQLEDLYMQFKSLGFKYHIQDLLTFLDRKCITIRTAQNNRKRNYILSQRH